MKIIKDNSKQPMNKKISIEFEPNFQKYQKQATVLSKAQSRIVKQQNRQFYYKKLLFIAPDVADYQVLINGVKAGYEILLLDASRNAIEQISQTLANRRNLNSIHIVSHGSPGVVHLGATQLSYATLEQYRTQLQDWGKSLAKNAAILLYGCNVADSYNPKSFEFLHQLSQITSANIAASTNPTGHAELGGDWTLEFKTGDIPDEFPFKLPIIDAYHFILPETFVNETFTGSTIDGDWIFGKGLDTSEPPKLTSAPAGVFAGFEPLEGTGEDPEGSGVLRLTENSRSQSAFAINNDLFPSGAGLNITFDFFAHGSNGNGADGFSFFLIDGNESPTTAGAFGGSLGYAQKQISQAANDAGEPPIPGIVGGYLGIGFDEFGNFANALERRVGGSPNLDSNGRLPDAVTIRGSEASEYQYLTDSGKLPISLDSGPARKRTVQIQLTADNFISVAIDFNQDGDFADADEAVITNFDVSANNSPLPETFNFGFGASTGGSSNFHELRNVKIQSIDPVADLETTKTGPTSALNGETITYTISTINNGPDDATNVVITDQLPSGLSGVVVSDGGTYDSTTGIVTWNSIASLANGAIDERTISFTAPDPDTISSITDTASSTSDTFDLDDSNNDGSQDDAIVTTTILPVADLVTTKNGPSTAKAGETITYTIATTNNGPDDATNVVITDQLPTGLTNVQPSDGGTYNSSTGEVTWNLDTVADGATVDRTISFTVPSSGSITNTALSTSETADLDPTNNDGSADNSTITTDIIPQADLETIKTGPTTATAGQFIIYSITTTNNGPSTATNVASSDQLIPGLTGVMLSEGSYNSSTGLVTFDLIPTLNSGESVTRKISLIVPNAASLTDTATSSSDTEDSNSNDNDATLTTTIDQGADLQVTKTVDNSTPSPGGTISYTITVTNNGPNDTTNVVVDDDLPTGVIYVSDNSGGAYDLSTGNWTVGNLANGESATLQIIAEVNSGTESTEINNSAEVIGNDQKDFNPTNNQADALIAVAPASDLVVTNTVDNSTPNPGEEIVYTITITNNGPDDATNVVIDDDLPPGVTYISDNSGGVYDPSSGNWTLGNLANGETATIQIVAQVNSDAEPGTIANTAQVLSVDQSDTDESNNQDTAVIAVQNPTADPITADLQVTKTVDNPTPNPGDAIVYTITATNIGPSNATGIVLDDDLPVGLSYISDNTATGTYNLANGNWTIGSLENGETATLEIIATVNPGTESTNIENFLEVAEIDQTDNNITNNQATALISVRPSAELTVSKTVDNPNPNPGEQIVYTITATNNGPDDATGLVLDDDLPVGLSYISDNTPTGTYNQANGNWTIGSLENGATATLEIIATVNPGTESTNIENFVEVVEIDQPDNDITNNQATALISVGPSAELAVSKTVDNSTPNPGEQIVYTIAVTNNGPNDATNVVIDDDLPTGVTYISDNSGGVYDQSSGNWTVGTLANGETATLEITATVNSDADLGSIANTAQVFSVDQNDSDESNNQGTAVIAVTESTEPTVPNSNFNPEIPDSPVEDESVIETVCRPLPPIPIATFEPPPEPPTVTFTNIGPSPVVIFPTFPLEPLGLDATDFRNPFGNELLRAEFAATADRILLGSVNNDLLLGEDEANLIVADDGNDILFGGTGSESPVGDQLDRDQLEGGKGNDSLNGNQGNDRLYGGKGNDILYGGKDNDWISGDDDKDQIFGDLGNDTISGGNGSENPIDPVAEQDIIFGNRGNDFLNGNEGNDTIYSGKDEDIAYGGKNDDWIYGDRANDIIIGDLGNDILFGGVADPSFGDPEGRDIVLGGFGNDFLNGNENNDTVFGNQGNDTAHGGQEHDLIFGNEGNDRVFGDLGNDTISGGNGSDNPVGTALDDDLIFGNRANDFLNGNEGNDTIYSGKDEDIAYGGKDDDLIYGDRANDIIIGDLGNDILFGGVADPSFGDPEGRDLVFGGFGNDFLNGNENNDTVSGGQGNDTAHGGQDDDLIYGNEGNDRVFGDLGNDTIAGGNGSESAIGETGEQDIIFGNRGNDLINGNEGQDTIYAGKDNDLAYGGKDNDWMYGDRGDDTLSGDQGDDSLFGGGIDIAIGDSEGRDLVFGGFGNDFLNGNENNDTVSGGQGNDTAHGGQDDDLIYGNEGNDLVFGDQGDDTIAGGNGSESAIGETGEQDIIFGNRGNDLINGNEGNDLIYAGKDNDLAYGGKDNDLVFGDRGDDTLSGDQGNDSLFGGSIDIAIGDSEGRDRLDGGDGDDFLSGNENNDTLSGGQGNDIAYGGKDNDLIHGDAGNDFLSGDLGDDSICGGLDNDTLIGGAGNDFLAGDLGSDSLVGGSGSDVFVLNLGGGLDIITDYQDGIDLIGLAGSLTFDQLTITQSNNNTLIQGGGQVLASFLEVQANSLTQEDFTLIG